MSKQYGYCIYNELSGRAEGIMIFPTDTMAAVETVPLLKARNKELDEHRLMKVCTFDDESMVVEPCPPIVVPFDCRRLKEKNISNIETVGE